MSVIRHLSRTRGLWLLALLIAALGARVAVPQGYMPAETADGHVVLTLCAAQGPVPMAAMRMAERAMPGMAHHHGKGDAPSCPFAPMGHAALNVAQPPLVLADAIAPVVPPQPPSLSYRLITAPHQRPPLRAPPLA